MLVLSRKIGEQIKIGKDIVIDILKIEGNTIRIGIEAPKDVTILRMEVFEKIQEENRESASREIEDFSDAIALIQSRLPKE